VTTIRLTDEQQTAREHLRTLAGPGRLRVTIDAEGWPLIPGRSGRIEHNGGRELAAYTDRPRLFAKLWAIPGVRRWQTGDTDMRAVFPAAVLPLVAKVIKARVRRHGGPGAPADVLARARAARKHAPTSLLSVTSGG
jgi:hypothetical protein